MRTSETSSAYRSVRSSLRVVFPLALLSMLLSMGGSCYGGTGGGWEPEPRGPELGPEPECFSDEDCQFFFGEDFFCGEFGFCEQTFLGQFCQEDAACYPLTCNLQEAACDVCNAARPCPNGTACGDDGRCFDSPTVDFTADIVPIFAAGSCVACHNSRTVIDGSDLRFDVDDDELYEQILLPGSGRVVIGAPMFSTIVTEPLREDPPDHPVGTWNEEDVEVIKLSSWINAFALRQNPCRNLAVSGVLVDCFDALSPENYCETITDANGSRNLDVVGACSNCDGRFRTFAPADICLFEPVLVMDAGAPDAGPPPTLDGGPSPVDGGDAPDAGPPPTLDSGVEPPFGDGGDAPDAGSPPTDAG